MSIIVTHQRIGDAISAAKKRLFLASKAGADLRQAMDQFLREVSDAFRQIIKTDGKGDASNA